VNGAVPHGAKVNWSFCDEQDIDSNPSDFEYERSSYESSNTTASDSRGSNFGSPDSYESIPHQGQYLPHPSHVDTLPNQALFCQTMDSSMFDTTAPNSTGFAGFGAAEVSNALNYASRFASYESKYESAEMAGASFVNRNNCKTDTLAVMDAVCKRTFDERTLAVTSSKCDSSDSRVRFSPEKSPQELAADASKRARAPASMSTLDTTAGSRSYRQQTSELINRLDKLLKFPTKPGSVGPGNKAARGSGGKGRSRRPPRDLAKPRARNVVLKQAAELIWRIKCDEQVIIFNHYSFLDSPLFLFSLDL
jgi:hypothetical protein